MSELEGFPWTVEWHALLDGLYQVWLLRPVPFLRGSRRVIMIVRPDGEVLDVRLAGDSLSDWESTALEIVSSRELAA